MYGRHYYNQARVGDEVVTDFRRQRSSADYFFTALVGFFLGIVMVLWAAQSFLGISLNNIWGTQLTRQARKMSQSERLIAEGSVIEVARRAKPSIANIKARKADHGGLAAQDVSTVGSGIVLNAQGYLVTNEHVVEGATDITVSIQGKKYKAALIGADKERDIAVVRIKNTHLPVPKFSSSRLLKVGELAVAIGSPFGLQRSVTAGVVSALNRQVTVNDELERPRTYSNLIQTDAAINPGNSGGALLNRKGEIVGMNSLIYSNSGVSQGVGFAIPIEDVINISEKIIGRVN